MCDRFDVWFVKLLKIKSPVQCNILQKVVMFEMDDDEFQCVLFEFSDDPLKLIEYLRAVDYDFSSNSQPRRITQHFECIKNLEIPWPIALEIARGFQDESSYCSDKFYTIMDEFEENHINPEATFYHSTSNWFLRKAFRKLEVLYASCRPLQYVQYKLCRD